MKIKNNVGILAFFAFTVAFSGCATTGRSTLNEQLDQKLAQETTVKTKADLRKQSFSIIESAPGLTPDQQMKLKELRNSATAETDQLTLQSLRLRSVLIKTLMDSQSSAEETDLLKDRIKNVEHERVSLFFKTVRGVNTILGRWGSRTERENQEFLDQMMLETMDLYYM